MLLGLTVLRLGPCQHVWRNHVCARCGIAVATVQFIDTTVLATTASGRTA